MAPQILFVAGFLSITWGIYLIGTIREYEMVRTKPSKQRSEVVIAMRRFIVALCAWLFVFSFVFRTACVLIGIGDEVAGQVVFYALLGANVTGSIFAIVSLKYD